MFETLRQDFGRYHDRSRPGASRLDAVRAALSYGFLATVWYRYGRWARGVRPVWLSVPLKALYLVIKVPLELTLGIDIPLDSNIGPGLHIGHFGGVFLYCDAGRHLTVGQGVTIGFKGAGKSTRWPTLGNDIYVGTGAKVIGPITVGDGVVIGANTVVTKDVPPRTRVVGAAIRMDPIGRPEVVSAGSLE